MRKLTVFNHITLDGYFKDVNDRFEWARGGNDDPEYNAWVATNASGNGMLLFGRVTYDLMASYWPTSVAEQHNPAVATGMNKMAKGVFSRSLKTAAWSNTRVISGDIVSEVLKMKNESGPDMVILGSGSIVAHLAPHKVIDCYQMVLDPVAIGNGKSMFEGTPEQINLALVKTQVFKNGKIFLSYERQQ